MSVPRFYFHIRDHAKIIADEEGMVLRDVNAAVREAEASAVGMLADAAGEEDDIAHQIIEVADRQGKVLASVSMRDVLDRAKRPGDGRH